MTNSCKGCGKPILWAETPQGKKVPLDLKPIVYRIFHNQEMDKTIALRQEDGQYAVDHFSACSHANLFSTSTKNAKEKKVQAQAA